MVSVRMLEDVRVKALDEQSSMLASAIIPLQVSQLSLTLAYHTLSHLYHNVS